MPRSQSDHKTQAGPLTAGPTVADIIARSRAAEWASRPPVIAAQPRPGAVPAAHKPTGEERAGARPSGARARTGALAPPKALTGPPPRPAPPRGLAHPPGPAGPKAVKRGHRRLAGGVIVGVVLLSSGPVAFVLARHGAAATASASFGNRPRAGVAISDRAAAWVAGQVSRSVTVSCDPVMCQALRARGFPGASLLELAPGRADPLPSSVIVATPAVRHLLGSRLGSVYAPAALASFGSGSTSISVRLIAPHGAAAYSAAFAADVLARKDSGAQMLRSQRITVSAAARGQLADGLVDSRLLVTIATLAARKPVSILAFGDLAPGASPGIPMRSADLAYSGVTGPNRAAYLRSILSFLRAQRGGHMTARIQNVRLAGGGEVLRIEFAAPSPLGLLSPRAG